MNIVVPTAVWKRYFRIARGSGALLVRGMLERSGGTDGQGGAINVIAERIGRLRLSTRTPSRDFRCAPVIPAHLSNGANAAHRSRAIDLPTPSNANRASAFGGDSLDGAVEAALDG